MICCLAVVDGIVSGSVCGVVGSVGGVAGDLGCLELSVESALVVVTLFLVFVNVSVGGESKEDCTVAPFAMTLCPFVLFGAVNSSVLLLLIFVD